MKRVIDDKELNEKTKGDRRKEKRGKSKKSNFSWRH